ncbi:MAG: hypothetical protein WCT04_23470 [Planctomycetota bacterium]
MIDYSQHIKPPTATFQFSLGLMMGAIFYAAAIATITINVAGENWNPTQKTVAYIVSIVCVVGFAVMSKLRGKVAAYLLLAPLMFVMSVVAGTMSGRWPLMEALPTQGSTTPVTSITTSPAQASVKSPDLNPSTVPSPLSGGHLGQ